MTDKKIKVLMIEDNPGDIRLIREMFKEVGISLFELETASCLKEGLEKIKETLYDVILLDLGLPDSRGLETFIKVNVQKQKVPIIVLTGLADETLALDAIKRGAQDYLVKEQLNASRLTTSISYAIERKRTERRLIKSEHWFRMLIETSPEVVTATDMEGRIIYVSPRTLELYGFKSPEELIGKNALEFISPEDHERAKKNLQITLRNGIVKDEHYTMLKKDGSRFIGELSSALVCGIEGELKGFVAITRDITERRRAEDALREQEEHYRIVFDEALDGICLADAETGLIIDCNQAMAALVGRERAELIGRPQRILHPPYYDQAAFSPTFKQHLTDKNGQILETQVVTSTGTIRDVEIKANCLNLQGRKVLQGVFRDITESKRAEEALKKSEEHFKDLVEKSGIAISSDDSQGNLKYFNERYAEIFGYSMEEMIKLPVLSLVHPEDREKVVTYHEGRLRDKNVPSRYEFRGIRKDGSVRYLEVDAVELREGERLVGTRSYMWDITDRKLAEEALQKRNTQLELIHHIQNEIPVNSDIETVLVQAAESIGKSFGYYKVSLNLYDRVTEEIEYLTGWNISSLLIPRGYRQKLGQGLIGKAGLLKQTIVANDVSKEPGYISYYLTETKAELIIPLVVQDQLIGVLDLQSTQINAFSEDDVSVLQAIASYIAHIIDEMQKREELRESEQKFRNLAEQTPNIIFINQKGKVVFANKKCEEIMGYQREEIYSPDFDFFVLIAPGDRDKIKVNFAKHLRGEEIPPLEFALLTKEGKRIEAILATRLIDYEGGKAILGTITDITDRKRAEEELRKSEERFRLVFESAPDAYYLNDLKGNFIDGNKAAEKLTGYKREELVGMSFLKLNLLSAEFIPKAAYLLVKNLRGKSTGPDEFILKRKDGSKIAVEISTHPVKLGGKAVVLGIARDITERKKGDQALKENEEKYRTLTENINIGVFRNTAGPKNLFIEANPALVRMFGYKNRKAFLALNLSDLYQNVENRERLIEKLLTKGFIRNEEVHVEKKDGKPIICSLSAVAVKDEDGSIQYFDGTIEDITERKRAEEALQESEEKYRTLVENAAEAILIAQDGMLKFVNRMASEIIGYSEQELRSSPFLEFIHPDDRQMVGERYLRRLNGDMSLPRYAFRLINKDGSIKWVEIDAVLVAWEDKPATLNFLNDITERKRAEEELSKHREHLEEIVRERTKELEGAKQDADAANRAKSVFLANMSHEIRTPMNAILGFSQLMRQDDTLNPRQRKHLDTINRSGEHLMALINDVLEMSKIEAGRTTLNSTTFDLRALLEDLEMMFRVRTDAKKLNFAVEGLGHIPDYVVGDQSKLLQVFINLLGNAVKFTEKGGILLRVRVNQESSNRLRLQAEVEDTGPGIPETELNNLFKPFQQTQNSRRAGSGTGLGLAISKAFVGLMGGDITVGSKDGTGCLIKFDVQLGESEAGSDKKKPESARVRGLRPGQPTYRILIADDDDTNLMLISQMLGNIGFETRQATNGEEAVETFKAWQPHLIFMDMRMPVMDGYEAIRRIRAGAGGRDVKIVIVSASAFEQNRQEALRAGADDFMAKPFREAVLFEMIGKLLGVEYVFSDEAGPAKLLPGAAVMSAITAEILSVLPEESVNKMRDAVINADFDLMMELVGGVEDHNILVAQELRSLIERFEYTEFLELLRTGRYAR